MNDYSIFISIVGINKLIISIFVNDIKIIGAKSLRIINCIKTKLTSIFKNVDIRPISFYFYFFKGNNQKSIIFINNFIYYTQTKYINIK